MKTAKINILIGRIIIICEDYTSNGKLQFLFKNVVDSCGQALGNLAFWDTFLVYEDSVNEQALLGKSEIFLARKNSQVVSLDLDKISVFYYDLLSATKLTSTQSMYLIDYLNEFHN
jgi:hypothetical protein